MQDAIIITVIAVIVAVIGVVTGNITRWLRGIVVDIEVELGSGTGQLKLAKAYNKFVEVYPIIGKIMPYAIFKQLVDIALQWMKTQLESNVNIERLIKG